MIDKDRIIELWRKVNRPGVNSLIGYLEESDFFTAPSSRDHHLAKMGGLAEHSLNVFDMLVEKCNRFSQLPGMPFFPYESIVICGLGHDFCKINYFKEGGEPAQGRQLSWAKELITKYAPYFNQEALNAVLMAKIATYPGTGPGHIDISENIPKEHAGLIIEWLKNGYVKQEPPVFPVTWSYDDKAPFGHGEKSVIILQQFIKLELFEALAIRWHMGAWDISDTYGRWSYNEAVKVHPMVTLLHLADMEATHIIEREKQ